MNCRKVTHLLSAYMDGELPGVEHRLIHLHLTVCPDCLADYEDLLQMKRLLGRMRVQSARKDMPLQIVRQIHAEDARAKAESSRERINLFLQLLRARLSPTQTLSIGLGFAVVVALYLGQLSYAPHPSNDMIVWEPPLAAVSDAGSINYPDAERFVARPLHTTNRNITPVGWYTESDSSLFQQHSSGVQFEKLVYQTH